MDKKLTIGILTLQIITLLFLVYWYTVSENRYQQSMQYWKNAQRAYGGWSQQYQQALETYNRQQKEYQESLDAYKKQQETFQKMTAETQK